ncbi:MAG: hypothetical protein KKA73_03400 [Chloroflexi bacterium]|nr:hypothetical protein [Chloroflexota bacterium]MBU1746710.1 hypothetical protein [Chloroflexota bacterium]
MPAAPADPIVPPSTGTKVWWEGDERRTAPIAHPTDAGFNPGQQPVRHSCGQFAQVSSRMVDTGDGTQRRQTTYRCVRCQVTVLM